MNFTCETLFPILDGLILSDFFSGTNYHWVLEGSLCIITSAKGIGRKDQRILLSFANPDSEEIQITSKKVQIFFFGQYRQLKICYLLSVTTNF